jgi:hypothetical protein
MSLFDELPWEIETIPAALQVVDLDETLAAPPGASAKLLKTRYFTWPPIGPDLGLDSRAAEVVGELTLMKRLQVEALALSWLLYQGEGFSHLTWRVEPSWRSRTTIGTTPPAHRFYMRGMFSQRPPSGAA